MNSTIVSYPERGKYGNPKYRGNCSGLLIKDLIEQYDLHQLSDYMVGGGTTEDVCRDLQIPGTFLDLNRGFDLMSMDIPERPENLFWHPPYGQMILYSNEMYSAQSIIDQYGFDPRVNDLSRARDWDDFVEKMNYCMFKQFSALQKGGRIFTLMGDWKQKGRLYSMLCDIAKPGTLEQIIIKTQHNCWSDRQSYRKGNFVPIQHEYLMVLRKDSAILIPVSISRKTQMDVRDAKGTTWRDVVASVLEDAGRSMSLDELYRAVDGHKKCQRNKNWQAKIRQTLQMWDCFKHVSNGVWAMAAA